MKIFIVWSITFYQRYLSPYKGYRCAYAALYQGDSCSAAIKKIILEHRLIECGPLIKNQFSQCSAAYQKIKKKSKKDRKCTDCCDPSCGELFSCMPSKSTSSVLDSGCDLPCDCGF